MNVERKKYLVQKWLCLVFYCAVEGREYAKQYKRVQATQLFSFFSLNGDILLFFLSFVVHSEDN